MNSEANAADQWEDPWILFSLLLFPRVDRLSAALGSVSFPQSAQTVSAAEGGGKTGEGRKGKRRSPIAPFKEMSPMHSYECARFESSGDFRRRCDTLRKLTKIYSTSILQTRAVVESLWFSWFRLCRLNGQKTEFRMLAVVSKHSLSNYWWKNGYLSTDVL